jgi:hypothetical protein
MLITSNLVFSDWERIFKEPMATAAAIDRLVDHAAILEFNVPSYRTRKRPAQRHRRRRRKCSRERRLRARRDGDARDPQRVPSITVAPYEGVKERRNRLNINLVATGKNSCHRTEEIVDAEHLQVWAGVDASVKPDSTAIVCATWDEENKRARLVWHRIFQPSPQRRSTSKRRSRATLLELRARFELREVRYDPYQLVAVAQRLTAQGLPMVEFAQSVPNLTEASTNLCEFIKGCGLAV